MERFTLEFVWSVSRGRDTYGYNICTLYVDGTKAARCNGGGYDMKGTCLGLWIAKRFSDELVKLKVPMSQRNGVKVREYYGLSFHDPDFNPAKATVPGTEQTVEEREKAGESLGLERYQAFYKASASVPSKRHRIPLIDGACGFSSVQRIVEALGYQVEYVPCRSNKRSLYNVVKK